MQTGKILLQLWRQAQAITNLQNLRNILDSFGTNREKIKSCPCENGERSKTKEVQYAANLHFSLQPVHSQRVLCNPLGLGGT
jgi:hypothetical protein